IASRSLTGVLVGDSVTYSGGTATFADKNVGTGKTVTATGLTLTGTDAANYSVNTTATTNANITAAPLTITAVTDSKTYDGTVSSSATTTVTGLQGSDTVTGKSQAFGSKNALGTNGSTLSVTGYTVNDGNSGANYTVSTAT